MKNFSAFRSAGLGVATAGAMLAAQTVSAKEFAGGEVSATAAVSNLYVFRGVDQGAGGAAVSGSLDYSHETGLYAGIWGSSIGGGGSEADLYIGYGIEINGLSVDLNVTNYNYPTDFSGPDSDNVGGFSEVILSLGYSTDEMGVSFQYADNVAGGNGYVYYALGAEYGDFSVTLGVNDFDEPAGQTYDDDITHLDVTYAYNDNLSFTVSKTSVDDEININEKSDFAGGLAVDDDTLFIVTYSLPIE